MPPVNAPLLYEDASMIAVSKPPGVVVIPARGEETGLCLQAALEASRGEKLWVVHRLDRDTSGVLLFARTAGEHRRLNGLFEGRQVQKRYLAWTRGAMPADEGVIDTPLHSARKGKMRPAAPNEEGALPSRTRYRVLRRWEGLKCGTLCAVELSLGVDADGGPRRRHVGLAEHVLDGHRSAVANPARECPGTRQQHAAHSGALEVVEATDRRGGGSRSGHDPDRREVQP